MKLILTSTLNRQIAIQIISLNFLVQVLISSGCKGLYFLKICSGNPNRYFRQRGIPVPRVSRIPQTTEERTSTRLLSSDIILSAAHEYLGVSRESKMEGWRYLLKILFFPIPKLTFSLFTRDYNTLFFLVHAIPPCTEKFIRGALNCRFLIFLRFSTF